MRLELHPKAEGEVESTVDWYEGQRVGLGAEFGDGIPSNGQVFRFQNSAGEDETETLWALQREEGYELDNIP